MQFGCSKRSRNSVVIMLFLYMVINFADKAVLGIVSASIMQDLNLSASEYGFIASSFFFFFFFISGIVFGVLSNYFSTKWIIVFLVFIWSVIQFPIVLWPSFAVLLICRIVLGIGQGPAYPIAIHALYKWFPDHQRNFMTMIIAQGGPIGIIFAVPLLTWITTIYGWKNAFLCLSLVGLIWLVFWLFIGKDGQLEVTENKTIEPLTAHKISYCQLIFNRSVLGIALLSFSAYWMLTMLLTWLPTYLQLGFGANLLDMSAWIALIVFMMVSTSLGGTVLSQYLLNKGYSTRYARAVLVSVFVFIGGLCTFWTVNVESASYLSFLFLAFAFALPNLAFSLCPTMVAEVAPVQQRGALLAIVHALATSAGVISPLVTGWIIDHARVPLEGYALAYSVAGVLLCLAGLIGSFMICPNVTKQKFSILSR